MPPEAAIADKPKELRVETLHRYLELPNEGAREVRKEPDGRAVYEIAISSEFPVNRWFGVEVLSHDKGAIDMSHAKRGVSFIDRHTGDVVGIVENIRLEDDKVLRGDLKFSRSARGQEFEQDFKDETRRFVSAGYMLLKATLVEKGNSEREDRWRITKWRLLEVSAVGTPADPTVGKNRSGAGDAETFPVEIEGGQPKEERRMDPNTTTTQGAATAAAPAAAEVTTRAAGGPAASPATVAAPVIEVGNSATRDAQVKKILTMCSANGVAMDRASDMIARGLSPEQAGLEILDARAAANTPLRTPAAELLDLSAREVGKYNVQRALRIAAGRDGRDPEVSERADGFEWEMHTELRTRSGSFYKDHGGILIPHQFIDAARQTRAMGTGVAGGGAETVFDKIGERIPILRNKAAVIKRGARVLSGLTAPIAFPEQTGDPVVFWVGENPAAEVAASQLNFGIRYLMPKTAQATVPVPKQLLTISSMDVQADVKNSLDSCHNLAIDLAALHGSGSAFMPMGIFNTPGVQTFAMGGLPDYSKLVDMTAKLPDKNADLGQMGWICSPLMAGRMKRTPVIGGAAAGFIWNGDYFDGEMVGFGASATKQISEALGSGGDEQGLLFGNFNDVVVGYFGEGLEVIVDPFTLATKGQLRITTFQMADVMLRRGVSFVYATGATLGS